MGQVLASYETTEEGKELSIDEERKKKTRSKIEKKKRTSRKMRVPNFVYDKRKSQLVRLKGEGV